MKKYTSTVYEGRMPAGYSNAAGMEQPGDIGIQAFENDPMVRIIRYRGSLSSIHVHKNELGAFISELQELERILIGEALAD